MPGGAGCARPLPAGGSVGVRMAPADPRAGNEPQKNGFLPQKHLLSEPFAVGVSARQVSRKKPAKRRCCSASARSEKGLKSLSEERGEKEKRKKKKNMCAIHLFRATHSANHPLHHSVPREKLLRNNLCYSREPGLCFCATWGKHKTFCPL